MKKNSRYGSRFAMTCVLTLTVLTVSTAAQSEDRVVLNPTKGNGPRTTLRGEIIDYRGDSLRIRLSSGKEETIDPTRLVELVTEWPAGQTQGEAAWRAGRWNEAIDQYRAAAAVEKRPWVKRRLLARLVECLRDARRIAEAGDAFLALYRADASTPYFHVIPLDWTLAAPEAADVEARAREWLKQDAVTPAVLMGASWLISRTDRAAAQAALRRLLAEPDARVAHLAGAQLWRTRIAAAGADETDRWRMQLDRMPDSLRGGPTFVLALAFARSDDRARAALEFMKIPILWNEQRELAALALWEAGRQLEQTPEARDAGTLYREIDAEYSTSSIAAAARAKLAAPAAPATRNSDSVPRTP